MKQLSAALVKARRAFGPALKDKTNPAFRSKYADLGACIDAVDDALLANGIALIQDTFEDESGVTVETVFLHESGEERRCGKLHVPAMKQDPQGYGSALTYARRYSLMAACGIAPEDDDGEAAKKAAAKPVQRAAGISQDIAISPREEAWKALQPEQQQRMRVIAQAIAREGEDFEKIAFVIDMASLDNDEKAGLWHLLDSKTRSGIKRHAEKSALGGKAQQAQVYETAK